VSLQIPSLPAFPARKQDLAFPDRQNRSKQKFGWTMGKGMVIHRISGGYPQHIVENSFMERIRGNERSPKKNRKPFSRKIGYYPSGGPDF
jgi:hypothetical protein